MDVSRYSFPCQKALHQGLQLARSYCHPHLEVEHIALALLRAETLEGLPLHEAEALQLALEKQLSDIPKYFGEVKVGFGPQLNIALDAAEHEQGDAPIPVALLWKSLLAHCEPLQGLHSQQAGDEVHNEGEAAKTVTQPPAATSSAASSFSLPEPLAKVLQSYTVDLTALAERNEMDPVIGRDRETRRVMEILGRKKKNNPVLIGQAGVGKTAVVECLAQRIVSGAVPESMRGKRILSLDLGSLVAGARFRGEFEERMGQLMQAIHACSGNIILFIDELHTIVGAGRAEGSMDAANLLKPALARGELHCIGATTFDEYRTHIEKDPALERRFQAVMVEEPSRDNAISILRGLKSHYQAFHGVEINDEALVSAVDLSIRFLADRFLPDKAIDLLDEACSRVRMQVDSVPKQPGGLLQVVGSIEIAEVISAWTSIPMQKVRKEEGKSALGIDGRLSKRIFGQKDAVQCLSKALTRMKVGMQDPNRPLGVFLFVGPTGVGKTEMVKALAEEMFDNEKRMVCLDMSEFMESHSVARLVGSPPGYVGTEKGGELTEAVRRTPYTVVLLDEIEKAHAKVLDLLLQVFEEGRLTDAKGQAVDFRNTMIVMTSNLLAQSPLLARAHPEEEAVRGALATVLRPEFVGRIEEVVVFHKLGHAPVQKLLDKLLTQLNGRLSDRQLRIVLGATLREKLIQEGLHSEFGGRTLRRAFQRSVIDPLSEWILQVEEQSTGVWCIEWGVDEKIHWKLDYTPHRYLPAAS